ncbi:MAG: hypothetical protein LC114_18325 [Bryobacterales bacterium]|nr:hypothetical protein [Bryobacterales bacterium]
MIRFIAARVLPVLLLAGSCLAVTLEQMSFEELIDSSTLVVRGTIVESSAAPSRQRIETTYKVLVSETLKGISGGPEETPRGHTLTVSLPGGAAGGIRQTVAGVPRLETGAEYILFLWRAKSGRLLPIGMSQGVFRVERSAGRAEARRLPIDGTLLDRKTGRAIRDSGLNLNISSLRDRVTRRASSRRVHP